MSCRRICRELLWLTRFGEVGVDSAPHLEHLSGCRPCRDEVGFDRAMVQQLREALLARVADADPSPTAWANIVARAQAPESPRVRLREWSTALVARLRVATGVAFTGLALILTLNTQIVPAGGPGSGETASSTDAIGDSALLAGLRASGRPTPATPARLPLDRGFASTQVPAQRLEPFVPPAIGTQVAAPQKEEPAVEEEPADSFVLVFELIEQPAPAVPAEEPETVPEPGPTPLTREPGEPS